MNPFPTWLEDEETRLGHQEPTPTPREDHASSGPSTEAATESPTYEISLYWASGPSPETPTRSRRESLTDRSRCKTSQKDPAVPPCAKREKVAPNVYVVQPPVPMSPQMQNTRYKANHRRQGDL